MGIVKTKPNYKKFLPGAVGADGYMLPPPPHSHFVALEEKRMKEIKNTLLPVGTRIRFIKELSSGADDFGPGNLYATKDSLGTVTRHGCYEGHFVLWDEWPHSDFGAVHGVEFVEYING